MTRALKKAMITNYLNWRSRGKMKKNARSKLRCHFIKSSFSFKYCQVFRKTKGDVDGHFQGSGDISVPSGVTLCQKGLVVAIYNSILALLRCQCHPYSVWLTLHVLYIFNCDNCSKEFCETLFLLFDHRREGRLVQDAWFSHIRNCSLIPG